MTRPDDPWPAALCQATGPAAERCQLPLGHAGGHLVASPSPGSGPASDPEAGPVQEPEPEPEPAPPPSQLPSAPPEAAAASAPGLVFPAQLKGTDATVPRPSTARYSMLVAAISVVIVGLSTVGIYGLGSLLDSPGSGTARPATTPFALATNGATIGGGSDSSSAPGATPALTGQPPLTPAPSAPPTPPASATRTATTGPTPGTLRYGPLTYTSAACFRVDLEDAQGAQTAGAVLDLALDVTNTVAARSGYVWIGVQTGRMFPGKPILVAASWSGRPVARHNDRILIIGGPRLDPGATRLTMRIVLQTPIDVVERVVIGTGADPAASRPTWADLEAGAGATWDISTAIDPCG